VNEVLPLDRTSGDLILRETTEQRNIPSHLAPVHPSTECPCIEPSVVWFEFSSNVPTHLWFLFKWERMPSGRWVSAASGGITACCHVTSSVLVNKWRRFGYISLDWTQRLC